eukprot:GILI01005227.1.p1 GENE.GILI01005227.1~~GILI01005227.1.p1  ORF type:complete len:807 (+),score=229.88 GILI01005227.1:90-2510(+)
MKGSSALFLSVLLACFLSVSAQQNLTAQYAYVFGIEDGSTNVLGINDIVYVLVSFDSDFQDPAPTNTSLCKPTLTLNFNNDTKATYMSRSTFNQIAGILDEEGNVIEPAAWDSELVFYYRVGKGQVVKKFDIKTPRASSFDFSNCQFNITDTSTDPVTYTPADYLDLSALNTIPLQPQTAVIKIDTRTPAVVQVFTQKSSGIYGEGTMIDIFVAYSKNVYVYQANSTTPPILELNSRAFATYVGFASTKDTSTLVFRYFVGAGDSTKLLDVASNSALLLREGAIVDAYTGLAADVMLPVAGTGAFPYSANISIVTTGYKFPPFKYDPNDIPAGQPTLSPPPSDNPSVPTPLSFEDISGRSDVDSIGSHPSAQFLLKRSRGRLLQAAAVTVKPVLVKVTIEFNAIFDVNEKSQTFKADFLMIQEWFDPSFKDPSLPPLKEYTTSILSTIWNPKSTFINSRDRPISFDSKVMVSNNGTVQLWERYINLFSTVIDARQFPFDTQTFTIKVRSSSYDATRVIYAPGAARSVQEEMVRKMEDASFAFSNYNQQPFGIYAGLLKNFAYLTTSVSGARIATFNSVNILLPLTLIIASCYTTFYFGLVETGRISVCATSLAATLSFSFVVTNASPPVNYITRMGLYILLTYACIIFTLFIQVFIRNISVKVAEVKDKERVLLMKGVGVKNPMLKHLTETLCERAGVKSPYENFSINNPIPAEHAPSPYVIPGGNDVVQWTNTLPHPAATKVPKEEDVEDKVESASTCFGAIVITGRNKKMWDLRMKSLNRWCRFILPPIYAVVVGIIIGIKINT